MSPMADWIRSNASVRRLRPTTEVAIITNPNWSDLQKRGQDEYNISVCVKGVCVCVCTYARMHVCMYVYVFTCPCVCMYVRR